MDGQFSERVNPWLRRRARSRSAARLRLFCFPHAGAGAAIFHGWQQTFPEAIDVCALEPPGRMARHKERALHSVPEFVRALDHALDDELDLPFVVFGYSLGSLLAFEWVRSLRRRQQQAPLQLIVAASAAPQLLPYHNPIACLPAPAFLQQLEGRYGPIDPVLRSDPQLLANITGMLRNDIGMVERYQYAPEAPLPCPIVALGGSADHTITHAQLEAWRSQTTATCSVQQLPGDHFFLRTHAHELSRLVQRSLQSAAALGAY